MVIAAVLVALPFALAAYCWFVYPLIVAASRRGRTEKPAHVDTEALPDITVVITAHNAGAHLRATLESILTEGYPEHRRRIIVVSDGSRDDTVRIARSMRGHHVRVHRIRKRVGKTAAENKIAAQIRSDVVVCVDASVRVEPGAIRALVQALQSPDIGVASGTDVLEVVSGLAAVGEACYVNREMLLRHAESSWSGIVGASGCFYALRRSLYCMRLPPTLTRDFASVLLARRSGLRSIAVPHARCRIAASTSGRIEFARKVRTILQGIQTLVHFRELLNPIRFGRFAVALFSHKLCRWCLPLVLPPALVSAAYLVIRQPAVAIAVVIGATILIGLAASRPASLRLVAYGLLVQTATISAWFRFVQRRQISMWDPTTRSVVRTRGYRDPRFYSHPTTATAASGSTASLSVAGRP